MINLKVHTDDGVLQLNDVRENLRTADFLADLIAETHKAAGQRWVLRDGSASGKVLQPELTLEQNHVGNDHNLYLVPAGPAPAAGPIVQDLDLQIVAPDGQALQVEVRSSTKVSTLLTQVPKHFGLELADKLGKPVQWALVLEKTGNALDSDKTLSENGIVKRAHLLLQRAAVVLDLVIETVAPDGQALSKELPPGTSSARLIEELLVHFALLKANRAGDAIEWFLRNEKNKIKLDPGRSLAENGIETGDRLLLEAAPGACLIVTVRTAEKEGRRSVVAGDTPVLEFIETLVVTFGLQQKANDGRPHVWTLTAPDRRTLDPGKTLAADGAKTGDVLTLLLVTPKLRLEVSAPGRQTTNLEKPGEFLTSALLAELVSFLELRAKDEQQRDVRWTLCRQGAPNSLDTSKSLDANGVVDGDKLALVPSKPRITPPPLPVWIWPAGLVVLALVIFGVVHLLSPGKPVIEVAPGTASLGAGETVNFRATTKAGADQKVRWTVSPAGGSITQQGVYKAPDNVATPISVAVTATSIADSSVSAQASVTLRAKVADAQNPPPSRSLNLSAATTTSLNPSGSVQFLIDSAPYAGTDLNWSLQPQQGTISASGLYTAPPSIATPSSVTVQVARTTGAHEAAQATISLNPPAPTRLGPQNALVGSLQQLQLTLKPRPTSPVQWSISPSLGSISQSGLYTGPPVVARPTSVIVTASSPGSFTVAATINLQPVEITPITLASNANRTYVLHSSVSNSTNDNVLWSISPQFGTISAEGVYTPPAAIPSPRTVQVTATSAADPTKSTHFEIALAATISAVKVQVQINSHSAALYAGQQQRLTATVTGSPNTTVTWSSSGLGNILGTGLFAAPATVAADSVVHIWATSNADKNEKAETTITVRPAPGYQGPTAGVVTWTGKSDKEQIITIANGAPGVSGLFPGVSFEATVTEGKAQIVSPMPKESGWKSVVVQTKGKEKKISITWKYVATGR